MEDIKSALAQPVRDLNDAVNDFETGARIDTASERLKALTLVLDAEPLKGFLASAIPTLSFEEWRQQTHGHEYSSGAGSIPWPAERPSRVALQIDLCRLMVAKRRDPLEFCRRYYRGDTPKHSDTFQRFSREVLRALVRDIERLCDQRPLPPELSAALRVRPRSSDDGLDGLLAEACELFRDTAPAQRQRALERLWDAWERAKTILDSDKKRGIQLLIAKAGGGDAFASLLDAEARACPRFCVNGSQAGNCRQTRRHDDYAQA